jgi:3-phosphoshikimate 1-carboxyvinyltransferase
MKSLILDPISGVDGSILLPGSKSISNRALLLAALAEGETLLENLLQSDDTQRMCEALTALGVTLEPGDDPTRLSVHGLAGPFPASRADLHLGNSGTSMRSLCAGVCLGSGLFTLTGIARMCERPIGDLVDALRQAGANIEYSQNEGFPPVRIHAAGLQGGKVRMRGDISSQFLTALLLAAPYAREPVSIDMDGDLVSKPYIAITIEMMRKFGVEVQNHSYQHFTAPHRQVYQSPASYFVEGDASSASYFLSAGAIAGGTVRVTGVGSDSIQGDVGHARVLEDMGAEVKWGSNWIEVSPGPLRGIDRDCSDIPDAAMTLAATALFAEGPTTLRNIYTWRLKETDRLAAMAAELRKVGAQVEEGRDFLTILPPEKLQAATIETYDDHRMAMSMSLAALGGVPITILDPDCVAKTFPDYFEKLASISQS